MMVGCRWFVSVKLGVFGGGGLCAVVIGLSGSKLCIVCRGRFFGWMCWL